MEWIRIEQGLLCCAFIWNSIVVLYTGYNPCQTMQLPSFGIYKAM